MKKKLTTLSLAIFLSLVLTNSNVLAKGNYNYSSQTYQNNSNLQGYASFVPAGITCDAVLSTEINSESAVVGQTINAVLTDNFSYNGRTIASKGSTIMGSVVSNKKAGFGNRNAKTQIRFTTIRTPYNNIIPISATIATNDGSGILKSGAAKDSAKDYLKNGAIGAGSGAALGTAMGALSGGSVGRGAVYGTAVGAGIGILKGASLKGDNILIPVNSRVTLHFDQPITLSAK